MLPRSLDSTARVEILITVLKPTAERGEGGNLDIRWALKGEEGDLVIWVSDWIHVVLGNRLNDHVKHGNNNWLNDVIIK